jgi:hypothetical protein
MCLYAGVNVTKTEQRSAQALAVRGNVWRSAVFSAADTYGIQEFIYYADTEWLRYGPEQCNQTLQWLHTNLDLLSEDADQSKLPAVCCDQLLY